MAATKCFVSEADYQQFWAQRHPADAISEADLSGADAIDDARAAGDAEGEPDDDEFGDEDDEDEDLDEPEDDDEAWAGGFASNH